MSRGLLITFEGVEGCGKSTLMRRLTEGLLAAGHRVETMREPGGTALGERIRSVVLGGDEGEPVEAWSELFLMLASRAQLVRERVEPCLAEGRIILCDRYMDASVAYQGGGRGLGVDAVQRLNRIATDDTPPDLTFLLDTIRATHPDPYWPKPSRGAFACWMAASRPPRWRRRPGPTSRRWWRGCRPICPKKVTSDDLMELFDVSTRGTLIAARWGSPYVLD